MCAAKDVGANAFLSSKYKGKIISMNPTTSRGEGTIINYHPKENYLVYACGRYIIFKNLNDPSNCFVYRAHGSATTVAKVSPTGYWVASGDSAGKLRIWSWDNPEHLTKLDHSAFAGAINDIDWDHESKKVVLVGEGSGLLSKVITWDTGNTVGSMPGPTKKVNSVTYKPTRPFKIMSCSEDYKVYCYSGPPFQMAHSKSPFTNFANCIRYSPDGLFVACVGGSKLQLFAGDTGEEGLCIEKAHEGTVYSVSWSPDSQRLATASADKTVKIWNLSLECLFTHSFPPVIGEMQVSVLWTKSNLISVSLNGNINVLNTEEPGFVVPPIQDHQTSISAAVFDPTTGTLYTGDNNGVIISRNMDSGVSLRITGSISDKSVTGSSHGGKVVALAICSHYLISVGFDDLVRYTPLTSTNMLPETIALNGQPTGVSVLGEGPHFAISTTNEVGLYSGQSRLGGLILPHAAFTCFCVCLSSHNEIILGCSDFKTRVYTFTDDYVFTNIATMETRSAVHALALRPSFDYLAIGDNGRQVEVFERGPWSEKVKGVWANHTSRVNCMAWSPNGKLIASGSVDECIIVWDFETPSKKLIIQFAHCVGVTNLIWLDDLRLVSTGNDGCIVLWNIPASL